MVVAAVAEMQAEAARAAEEQARKEQQEAERLAKQKAQEKPAATSSVPAHLAEYFAEMNATKNKPEGWVSRVNIWALYVFLQYRSRLQHRQGQRDDTVTVCAPHCDHY